MPPIQNITGLEKPLEKLVEVVSEGLGVVANEVFNFDAKKIKRIGEAEAEVEKGKIIKKAEGQSEALEILGRAQKRFYLEQYNKQINLENVVVGAKELLEGSTVSDQPVDKDWASRFMNMAQDVSREDMQKLLSRILAEEIKQPNTFSLRTLDFVKNISKEDIILFRKFAILSNNNSIIYITKDNLNEGFFNISYGEIMVMIELGFIQSSLSTVFKLKDLKKNTPQILNLKQGIYIFQFTEDVSNIDMPILQFTTIGKELSSLLDLESEDQNSFEGYIEELKNFFKNKKLEFLTKR